jgi:hypothetical protein
MVGSGLSILVAAFSLSPRSAAMDEPTPTPATIPIKKIRR